MTVVSRHEEFFIPNKRNHGKRNYGSSVKKILYMEGEGEYFFFSLGQFDHPNTYVGMKNLREIFGRIKIRLMRLRRFSRKPQVVEVNTFLPYVNFD